jgi:hypothetical protein
MIDALRELGGGQDPYCSASIVKARLQEAHTIVADQINQSIFACDAPRPDVRAHLLEVLGLSDPGKGVPYHSLDQIKNP